MIRLALSREEKRIAEDLFSAVCTSVPVESCRSGTDDPDSVEEASIFVLIELCQCMHHIDQTSPLDRVERDRSVALLLAMHSANEPVAGILSAWTCGAREPIELRDVLTRARASVKGSSERFLSTTAFGDTVIDHVARTVTRNGTVIDLSPSEFEILELLSHRPNAIVSKELLLDSIGGTDRGLHSNVVEAHISNLRKKLAKAGCEPLFVTVRGRGYLFIAPQCAPEIVEHTKTT